MTPSRRKIVAGIAAGVVGCVLVGIAVYYRAVTKANKARATINAQMEQMDEESELLDHVNRTRHRVITVFYAAKKFRIDVGRYPAQLDELLKKIKGGHPLSDMDFGPYAEEGDLEDTWGRPLRYSPPPREPERLIHGTQPEPFENIMVWSVGRNGKDENGEGDDIVFYDQ